jgi:hypothetical protein
VGRTWSRIVGAVAGVALVAGCASGGGGGSDAVSTLGGAPVVTDATTAAGGRLPDGFSVPDGTVLLGAVEPTGPTRSVNGVIVPERGWRALLLVTGDPYDVLDEIRAQAARTGMPGSLMPRCEANTHLRWFECEVDAYSPGFFEDPARGAGFFARLTRGPGNAELGPMSHLLLSFSEIQPATPRQPEEPPAPMDRTEPVPPFPVDWPPPLQPGDPFGTIRMETWLIEEGTRLVGPPSYTAVCATGGFDAVFEVTGDAKRVVDGYARQFEARSFGPVRGDWDVDLPGGPSASFTGPGAGEVSARTVDGPGGRTYLWLSRCND